MTDTHPYVWMNRVFLIISLIMFILAALNVGAPFGLVPAGLAFFVAAHLA